MHKYCISWHMHLVIMVGQFQSCDIFSEPIRCKLQGCIYCVDHIPKFHWLLSWWWTESKHLI